MGSSRTRQLTPCAASSGELRSGALAGRECAGRPENVVGAEAELGEEGSRLFLLPPNAVDERLVNGEATARLLELAEHDSLADVARP